MPLAPDADAGVEELATDAQEVDEAAADTVDAAFTSLAEDRPVREPVTATLDVGVLAQVEAVEGPCARTEDSFVTARGVAETTIKGAGFAIVVEG
jgi:hypothetical protein